MQPTDPDIETRCGFVSVIGLPNAGKSTLINQLVGSKISIVSRKVQTTRNRILALTIHDKTQIILMDTPGVFDPSHKSLERAMVAAAWETVEEADILIHLVDAAKKNALAQTKPVIERLQQKKQHNSDLRLLLALNKVDCAPRTKLLELAQTLNEAGIYDATYMISGLNGSGVNDLKDDLAQHLPPSVWMYPEDQMSDMPMRFIAAEITREKIYDQLHDELPYAIMVETEEWEQFDNGDIKIGQVIKVQRDTQKAIVLGKGGSRIKKIGAAAREELSEMMGCKIHLKLFVRTEADWAERADNYSAIGLEYPGKH